MVDNEMLLAISNLLDAKFKSELEPIKNDIRNIRNDIGLIKGEIKEIKLHSENIVDPKLQLIYENYVPASQKYENTSSIVETLQADVDILKKVVSEHSKQLKEAQ